MRLFATVGATFLTVIVLMTTPGAAGVDLHWLWENQCEECHGHSGQFARKFLKLANGRLEGRHHAEDLRLFMRNHYAFEIETDAIYELLLAQTQTEPRFKRECASCHGNAAPFIRKSIILRDGILLSRKTGQSTKSFLQQHRGLKQDDVQFFTALLRRIVGEVYRP